MSDEKINHPAHYGGDTLYEAIKVIEAWGLNFHLGNMVKYICRAGKKSDSDELEDLRKAEWYLRREISRRQDLWETRQTQRSSTTLSETFTDGPSKSGLPLSSVLQTGASPMGLEEHLSGITRAHRGWEVRTVVVPWE